MNKKILISLTVIMLVIITIIGYLFLKPVEEINSFEECAKAGYPILESYPRQCRTSNGKNFIEELSSKEKEKVWPPCGDGICTDIEKYKTICPKDCGVTLGFEDSPFITNDFTIPSGVAKVVGITTKEQMAEKIESEKIPYFKDLEIKWARLHPNIFGTFGWSGVDPDHDGKDLEFSKQDAIVKLAQENNIHLLVSISPTPTDTEWLIAQTYIPENKEAYSSYVKQIVERYDGDGIDDMPGLEYPIKYWQLDNEPDLHYKVRKTDFSSPDEYFEVLKLTYQAVKEADNKAKLMLNVVGEGQSMGDTSISYLTKLNSLGATNYYDIFSYHIYPNTYDTSVLRDNLQRFKELAKNKPIWITESGINSEPRQNLKDATEKNQASWVIKHHVFHLANGVKKIVWLSFTDMSPNVPETKIAKYAGLLTFNPTESKLSYYTYKKMVEILEESNWGNIEIIKESDGIYIYKFIKNNKPIWVAWNDNDESQEISISGINSNQVKIIEAVPKYDSGKEVVNYENAFNVDINLVSNNKITIILKDIPVFIEEE